MVEKYKPNNGEKRIAENMMDKNQNEVSAERERKLQIIERFSELKNFADSHSSGSISVVPDSENENFAKIISENFSNNYHPNLTQLQMSMTLSIKDIFEIFDVIVTATVDPEDQAADELTSGMTIYIKNIEELRDILKADGGGLEIAGLKK